MKRPSDFRGVLEQGVVQRRPDREVGSRVPTASGGRLGLVKDLQGTADLLTSSIASVRTVPGPLYRGA
jgi:hypothetical protein